MRVCPYCSYENPDSDTTCGWCSRALPPPTPIPLPRAAARTRSQKVLRFVLGAVLGLIPAAIFAGGAFAGQLYAGYFQPGWPFLGCLLFPVALIIMGIAFSRQTLRPLAYGLLAAALISPIVIGISCNVAAKG